MKTVIFTILSLLFVFSLNAQQTARQHYVIYFKDKGSLKSVYANPSLYVSQKAVERHLKHNIPFDDSDIPVNEQYIQTIVKQGASVLARSRWFNYVVVEAGSGFASQLESIPYIYRVEKLSENVAATSFMGSTKPYFENESVAPYKGRTEKHITTDVYDYGSAFDQINQIKGQYLHNQGFDGRGMTIAVLDAGFNSADVMPCFDSLRKNNQIKGTKNFAVPGENVYSTTIHTHGTMVLSTMAAYVNGQMVGTAPKADYWLLRSEYAPTESIIEEYYWASAAEYADSVGADLINSSLGYTTFDDPSTNHTYANMDGNTTVITIAADKAAQKGILVVNSAGNDGGDSWNYIGAPADGDSVFSIGAVDANGIKASFSSFGPTYDGRIKPDIAARGVSAKLYAPSGFSSGSGTSFSSPIICGMTACLWQSKPSFNNVEIINAIKSTASQATNPDNRLGWGIPDYQLAKALLTALHPNPSSAPVVFPNPVKDKVTVSFPDSILGVYEVDIIDLQGKTAKVFHSAATGTRSIVISQLDNLKPGIYLIKVKTNKAVYSSRMIKI